jgi:hypothetical protein
MVRRRTAEASKCRCRFRPVQAPTGRPSGPTRGADARALWRSSKDGLRSDRGGHGESGFLTSRESRRQVFFGSLHSRRASARHRVSSNRPRPRRRGARPDSLESVQTQSIRSGSELKRQVSSSQPLKENPTDGSSYRLGRPEVLLDGRGPNGSAEPDGSVPGFRNGNSPRRVPTEDALPSRFGSGNAGSQDAHERRCRTEEPRSSRSTAAATSARERSPGVAFEFRQRSDSSAPVS